MNRQTFTVWDVVIYMLLLTVTDNAKEKAELQTEFSPIRLYYMSVQRAMCFFPFCTTTPL